MNTAPVGPHRDDTVLAQLRGPQGRPLLLTGGTVITGNPRSGDWQEADVLIVGDVVAGVGPGLLTAAADDDMIVVDCAGTLVQPAVADFTTPRESATLTPGEAADIAVLRLADDPRTPPGAVAGRGSHLDILVSGGQVRIWNGRPLDGANDERPGRDQEPPHDPGHPHLGMWVDEKDFIRQELLPDGRYDEARGERSSAYRGRYWINGTRIDYLDDLGFWAFGEFRDGCLHHAGYRFTRR